jgi:molybdopterin synthase sulfur carrier subunit
MKYRLKAFGIAREILGGSSVEFESAGQTIGELRADLDNRYPRIRELSALFIAVNESYADDDHQVSESDEIALIPPVSGG